MRSRLFSRIPTLQSSEHVQETFECWPHIQVSCFFIQVWKLWKFKGFQMHRERDILRWSCFSSTSKYLQCWSRSTHHFRGTTSNVYHLFDVRRKNSLVTSSLQIPSWLNQKLFIKFLQDLVGAKSRCVNSPAWNGCPLYFGNMIIVDHPGCFIKCCWITDTSGRVLTIQFNFMVTFNFWVFCSMHQTSSKSIKTPISVTEIAELRHFLGAKKSESSPPGAAAILHHRSGQQLLEPGVPGTKSARHGMTWYLNRYQFMGFKWMFSIFFGLKWKNDISVVDCF